MNNLTIISIIVYGGLALIAICRGLYTIYKHEGPLMGRGKKKYIVRGKYAVWAGVGQVIIGLAFLIMVFNSYSLLVCTAFLVVLILGTFLHFAGSFRDPELAKEFQHQQELITERDNDQVVIIDRKKSIVKYIVISLVLGMGIAAFMFYLGRETTKELSSMESIQFFLLGTTCFSSLFILGFLSVAIRKRNRGEW